jgi:hypothetical protein
MLLNLRVVATTSMSHYNLVRVLVLKLRLFALLSYLKRLAPVLVVLFKGHRFMSIPELLHCLLPAICGQ